MYVEETCAIWINLETLDFLNVTSDERERTYPAIATYKNVFIKSFFIFYTRAHTHINTLYVSLRS